MPPIIARIIIPHPSHSSPVKTMPDQPKPFRHIVPCSHPHCHQPAAFKIAAAWSDGPSSELKTYGFACDRHHAEIAGQAAERRAKIQFEPAENETLGAVEVHPLDPRRQPAET